MSNPDTNPRDSLDTLPNAQAPDGESRGDVQGEGNVDADRRYREGVKKTIASGDVEQLAEDASRALDGEEGEELRAAEEKGRNAETNASPQRGAAPSKAAPSKNGPSSKNGT